MLIFFLMLAVVVAHEIRIFYVMKGMRADIKDLRAVTLEQLPKALDGAVKRADLAAEKRWKRMMAT